MAGKWEFICVDALVDSNARSSVEYSFSLNFSRPAHPIIAQYFNFIHLGFEGYRSVALDDLKNARLLARALDKSGYYTVLSEVHQFVNKPGLLENTKKAVGIDEEDIEVVFYFNKMRTWLTPKAELLPFTSCRCVQVLG